MIYCIEVNNFKLNFIFVKRNKPVQKKLSPFSPLFPQWEIAVAAL